MNEWMNEWMNGLIWDYAPVNKQIDVRLQSKHYNYCVAVPTGYKAEQSRHPMQELNPYHHQQLDIQQDCQLSWIPPLYHT